MSSRGDAPLIVHVVYKLDYGGLENGMVNIINRTPAGSFRHAVVCLAGFSEFRFRIRRSDVEVYSLDKRPGKDLGVYFRLWKLLRSLRPAIVHTRNRGTVDMQWIAWASRIAGRVHGEHGYEAEDPRGVNPKYLRIRRLTRPVIRRYVTVSKDLARWLREQIRVPAGRVQQIYNGVDVERFAPNGDVPKDVPWAAEPKSFVFGTVGRLDPVKQQEALLDAFASLQRKRGSGDKPLRLIIAGSGALFDKLKARALALGVADDVWLPGPRSDVPALMRTMNVFVLPSMNEGISNTILEAMATGLPIVAARVGGNPELVQNAITGTLYEESAPSGLEEAMARYAARPELAAQHGAAGHARAVTDFSMDSMVNSYLDLYRRLAESGGAIRQSDLV